MTQLTPYDLRCDHGVAPLGVDSRPPRLSWKLKGEGCGRRQTAWQIGVASSEEALRSGRADLWDSGRVESSEQLGIIYAGPLLTSSQQAFWHVRVWDENGVVSAFSEITTWTMGVLQEAGWQCHWITDMERLAAVRAKWAYHSAPSRDPSAAKWILLDLGRPRRLDELRLYGLRYGDVEGTGFVQRYKVEGALTEDFSEPQLLVDQTAEDIPWNAEVSAVHPLGGARVRYVRLLTTQLRGEPGEHHLVLSQIALFSRGKNLAPAARISAGDSLETDRWSLSALNDGKGVPLASPLDNATLLVRKTITVRSGVRRALIHLCGLGHYELTLNSARVSADLISPGWTAYEKTCLYDTYDVTALLKEGINVLGVFLGNGFYNVRPGRYRKLEGPFRPLTLIAQLRIEYVDDSVELIGTDDTWRVHPGPIVFSNVFGGEDHDARRVVPRWDQPDFNDSGWATAVVHDGPGGELRGYSHASPPMRAHETLQPVKIVPWKTGAVIYDLGQNAALMPRLHVSGPAGSQVRITPSELLFADGTPDTQSRGKGDVFWTYTLAGDAGGETWTPRFFYHGARYLGVELIPAKRGAARPEIIALTAAVVHAAVEPAGEFACSSELFNRIRTLIRWAQRSNLASVITDCPHRERLGWLEQYHLNGPSLRYEFNLTRLYAKTFTDMADAQLPGGLVPDIAPEYVQFSGGFRDSPEWGGAFILAAWQHFIWTGDDAPLRAHYEAMKRYQAHLAGCADQHVLSHGLGDWCDLGPGPQGFAQLTPVPLTATSFHFLLTQTLSLIATRLGEKIDAGVYAEQAVQIGEAFNRAFFDREAGGYATGSQCANALPLALGLVAPEDRGRVLAALVRDVRARGNAITAGDVGHRYLLRALAQAGLGDVIFDLHHQDEKPGYGFQLRQGCTSLAETWDARRENSQNHFMLGHITEWFYRDLAGIGVEADGAGFETIVIRPQPVGDVTWVRASSLTPRGKVSVAWQRTEKLFELELTLPPNTSAVVHLPRGEQSENGKPIAQSESVTFLREEALAVLYRVSSGSYAFSTLH